MIYVIKPSPYNSVWQLNPGVPSDGTGTAFNDPLVWQLHLASDDPTKCIYTAPTTQYFYILVKLEANITYDLYIGSNTGPIFYTLFKQSDSNTIIQEFDYYADPHHTFTVTETGNYILRGTNYYNTGDQEDVRIEPAPPSISGEASWDVDKSRVQPGIWDRNGILTGFRDLHSAQIGITNIPQIPLDGLWAYYPLVKNANDVSGNKRHLNEFGNPVYSTANGTSGFSTTTYFNVSGYVSGTNPRSICMWFRFIGTDSNESAMFCQGEENYGKNFALTRYDDDRLRAHTYGWSDGSYTLSGKNDLHHVVMTYEQSSSSTKRLMYVDGVLVKEWSSNTTTSATNMFFGIFANGNTANGQYGFSGYMHDIALYTRAITADEVLQIYNAGNSLRG